MRVITLNLIGLLRGLSISNMHVENSMMPGVQITTTTFIYFLFIFLLDSVL